MILTADDFSPRFDTISEGTYLQRGDDRYAELIDTFRINADDVRGADAVSPRVKRYLAVFVSKEYSRDRIGTNIGQGIDGQSIDHWAETYKVYDDEETAFRNELSVWDFLSDEARTAQEIKKNSSLTMDFFRS